MKIKKFIILTIASLILISMMAEAQQSYIKNRWDIKLGLARPHDENFRWDYFLGATFCVGNWAIDANYGINEFITAGAYTGYSAKEYIVYLNEEHTYTTHKTYNTFFTGIKFNLHIFPLFIKHNDFRFDLYLTGKAGGYYYFKPKFEYNAGAGLAFYPSKHLGIFTEYTFGNVWMNNYYWRFGFVVKFNQ